MSIIDGTGLFPECSEEGDPRGCPQYIGPGDERPPTDVQHVWQGGRGTGGRSAGRVYPGGR